MLRVLASIVLLGVAAASPGVAPAAAQEVRVAAASSVRYALDEIVAAYAAARPEARLSVSYGSSGALYADLVHGAPYDLFLAADDRYTAELERRGRVEPGTRGVYALGRLVVWAHVRLGVPEGASAAEVLASPQVGRIAVANEAHAPYGRAAVAYLEALGLLEAVEGKLVRGENVAQAAQIAVRSGGVGLLASSLVRAPGLGAAGRFHEVPRSAHAPLRHESVVVAGRDRPAVRAFRAFLATERAGEILERHGLERP